MEPTLSHRLILPADANHHGTLYAGSLLRLALEAGYATAWRFVGAGANLVLRRVLNLECLRPVPVGTVVEIQGHVLHRSQVETGFFVTPWPVVVAIMAPIAGRLSDRYPVGLLGGLGLVLLGIGMTLLATLPVEPSITDIVWRMAICGLGFGFFQTPNLRAIMSSAPPRRWPPGTSEGSPCASSYTIGPSRSTRLAGSGPRKGPLFSPGARLYCGI